jgi:hypothetical protein
MPAAAARAGGQRPWQRPKLRESFDAVDVEDREFVTRRDPDARCGHRGDPIPALN